MVRGGPGSQTRRPANAVAKVGLLLLLVVLAQTTFASDLRVHDVAPDFMLLLAVAAGFSGGPDKGAVVGFAAGLVGDLFVQSTPFGLSALAWCLAGYAVGWARTNLLHPRLLLVPAVAAAGTTLGVAVFVVIGYIVGQAQLAAPGKSWLVTQAVLEACWAAVFSLPAVLAMGWALRVPASGSASISTSMGVATPGEATARRHPSPSPSAGSRRRHKPRAGVR